MVEITINGIKYNVEYGFNAICALQKATNKDLSEIILTLTSGAFDLDLYRSVFWAGLLANNRNVTLDDAGDLLDASGKDCINILGKVLAELNDSTMTLLNFESDKNDDGVAKNSKNLQKKKE